MTKETRDGYAESKAKIEALTVSNAQLETRNQELVEIQQKLQDQLAA